MSSNYCTFAFAQQTVFIIPIRNVWRYQRGNQNSYIEEEQIQWPKEKVQMGKQRSTKHTYTTKDRVTRIPLNTVGELMCSGKVGSSCSTSDTRRVNLVTNPVISREWGKGPEVFTTSGTYQWSFVTQLFHSGLLSHGAPKKIKWVAIGIILSVFGRIKIGIALRQEH